MAVSSRTSEFRQMVRQRAGDAPDPKRRRLSRSAKRSTPESEKQELLNKEYVKEAYNILNHISTLTRMLTSVRKAYLNVDTRTPPLLRQAARTIDITGGDQSWSDIRSLTNEERDQIDLQARVILSRCKDRVAQLEEVEKRRVELAASRQNPLIRLLPARLRQDDATATSDFVAAHHSSITWFLSRRLAETGQHLRDMQEERMKRQMERTRTLGSGATREAVFLGANQPNLTPPSPAESSASGSWLGNASNLASSFAASIGSSASPFEPSHSASTIKPGTGAAAGSDWMSETDEEELELSASQIQQFEEENANILQSVQDTLQSVQQAEARLMEISALQMELVAHLTKQTEQTEQLYEDAIATAATVEKGNEQLKEARRRARDGRKWILLFLIGASLSLLFLHYY
ncbi:snare protein syntaxin 18/UFE1 [Dichomitus squalens]|uniref:Snare protein syntaxin 18/UFE1 n=1 Tax=Dichomitus squalens TaxID=114155 RepID=A0A4Q9PWT1_9APHY|nr:snare protein syntaxin 18/UFE1 [Dichomitus squalens]TBU59162.1 snare protein syntaxin 18/UFE1 [Dichomitus squalens]